MAPQTSLCMVANRPTSLTSPRFEQRNAYLTCAMHSFISTFKDEDAIKLFVGQVPRHMDENHLRPIFDEFGEIFDLAIIRDRISGVHRGKRACKPLVDLCKITQGFCNGCLREFVLLVCEIVSMLQFFFLSACHIDFRSRRCAPATKTCFRR